MKKSISLFVAGALVGVFVTYLWFPSTESGSESTSEARSDVETITRTTINARSTQSNVVPGAAAVAGSELADLQARIEADALGALLDAAARRGRAERRQFVTSIGRLWARIDPEAALIGASVLPPELVEDYNASVASEWANLDAEGFFEFAERTVNVDALVEGLDLLIATDPARVYQIGSRIESYTDIGVVTLMHPVQRAALHALADRDPLEAMRLIEPMLPQIDLTIVAQEVVTRFARNDPDAAWAWLNALDAATDTHRRVVLEGIAQVDFARALEFASTMPGLHTSVESALARAVLSDTTQVPEVASVLLNQNSQMASRVLEQLLGTWAFRAPDELADWMLANSDALDASLSQSIASRFAASDLDLAMALLDRIPPHLSRIWVSEIAGAYAAQQPAAALDWIRQFQGQAIYEDLHARVVMQMVAADPELAATMIDEFSPALRSAATPGIAWALAEADPSAAAQWATSLDDPSAASTAVFRVVNSWVRRDLNSATDWAMDLERGELRDQALYGLIVGSYGTNLDPRSLLDDIDSFETRRMAQVSAMMSSVFDNPDLARELAEALVDDPLVAVDAREVLAALERSGN